MEPITDKESKDRVFRLKHRGRLTCMTFITDDKQKIYDFLRKTYNNKEHTKDEQKENEKEKENNEKTEKIEKTRTRNKSSDPLEIIRDLKINLRRIEEEEKGYLSSYDKRVKQKCITELNLIDTDIITYLFEKGDDEFDGSRYYLVEDEVIILK